VTSRALSDATQGWFFDLLEQENDEVHAAVQYCLANDESALASKIVAPLWRYWHKRGRLREGRQLLDAVVGASTGADRAAALESLAGVRYWQADHAAASELYEEALALFEDLGDQRGQADAIFGLSSCLIATGDLERARPAAERAFELYGKLGNELAQGHTLIGLSLIAQLTGDWQRAHDDLQRAIDDMRRLGDHRQHAHASLGMCALLFDHDVSRARQIALGVLDFFEEDGDPIGLAWSIDALAKTEELSGRPKRALVLAASADKQRVLAGGAWSPAQTYAVPVRESTRSLLEDDEYERLCAEGTALAIERTVAMARAEVVDDV
jgi:tetratricopeptide (TPR) repeat protein